MLIAGHNSFFLWQKSADKLHFMAVTIAADAF
jgi:hypothetical protein